jgi:hypothetical protein
MKIKHVLKGFSVVLCFMLSNQSFARPQNAISTCLVDTIIADIITRLGVTPGNGIAITTDSVTGAKTISVTPELALGDLYQGGVVFRLDETKRHGLIVSINEGSEGFYSSGSPVTASSQSRLYTQGNGIGSGKKNTTTMTTSQSVSGLNNGVTVGPAAMSRNTNATTGADAACDLPEANATGGAAGNVTLSSVSTDCVGGWYLPSAHEMFLLRVAFDVVNTTINAKGGTPLTTGTSANYWTSSTINSTTNTSGSGVTYTTPGMSAYYVNFGTTTTTATPTDKWANDSSPLVTMYRWIRAF